MPLNKNKINVDCDLINNFRSETFDEKVKRLANAVVSAIDNYLQNGGTIYSMFSVRPDNAHINEYNSTAGEAALRLVKDTYRAIGWKHCDCAFSKDDYYNDKNIFVMME